AHSRSSTQGSLAAVATDFRTGVHRSPWRRIPGGGARDSLYDSRRKRVSRPRSDPVSDVLRYLRNLGRRRLEFALRDSGARSCSCGTSRATGRAGRGVRGSKARDRGGDRTARPTGDAAPVPRIIVEPIRVRGRQRLEHVEHRSKDGDGHPKKLVELSDEIESLLIDAERDLIINLYRAGELNDEARRRVERELDLREARLANLRAEE